MFVQELAEKVQEVVAPEQDRFDTRFFFIHARSNEIEQGWKAAEIRKL